MGNKNGAPVLRQEDIDALTNTSGMDETQVMDHLDCNCVEMFLAIIN